MNGNCIAQDETNILFTTGVKTPIPIQISDIHIMKKYELDVNDNIIHEHDYGIPVSPRLTDLLENVVAYIAGYAVKMTHRILKCPTCIDSMYEDGPGDRNLLLLFRKKWGNLVVPSRDATIVCREVEITLRRVLSLTNNQLPTEANFQHTFILSVYSKLLSYSNLFKCIDKHNMQNLTIDENHVSRLVKSLCLSYYKIRVYNLAKSQSYSIKGNLIRKKLNKLILFSHQ